MPGPGWDGWGWGSDVIAYGLENLQMAKKSFLSECSVGVTFSHFFTCHGSVRERERERSLFFPPPLQRQLPAEEKVAPDHLS